jgi:hypothetical protein
MGVVLSVHLRRTVARPAVALILVASLAASGCGLAEIPGSGSKGEGDAAPTPSAPPPPPAPALTQAEVKAVLARFAARERLAHRTLNPARAATAFTGSSLQMELAKYKVFKANKVRITPSRYGQILGATPKFSGHPKWFFAAMTDRGGDSAVRNINVFVQDKPGGPWRAAYTPIDTVRTKGALARRVDVADAPDVAPLDDPTLALAPGQVSAAMADVINLGTRSARIRSFTIPDWARTRRGSLASDRTFFRSRGWKGTARYAASRQPAYAVRTTNGGALVWSAIELKEAYRHTGARTGVQWEHDTWGDLLKPFTGRSSVKRSLTTIERIEMFSYVPPKGRGKVQVLATRWAPITITGN